MTAGLSREVICKKLVKAATRRTQHTGQELVERAGLDEKGYDARGVARFIGELVKSGALIRHHARKPRYTKP